MSDTAKTNVVNLESYGQRQRVPGNSPAGSALRAVRQLALENLRGQIERVMEKVDDALFARAEKAENNMAQTRYFDAMRELRIIRKDIEEDFVAKFGSDFDQGIPRQVDNTASFSVNWEDDKLDLVDKDDVEENLAVSNTVNKIRGNCTQSLYALDKRMGFLLHDPDLEKWHNPVGPEAICNAFQAALKRVETGIEIRLVIFKLFDQMVTRSIDALYRELNQQLVKMGVLPEIRATIRRSVQVPAPGPATPAGGGVPGDGPPATGGDTVVTAGPGGYPGAQGVPLSTAVPAAMQPSINALTFLQHGDIPVGEGGAGMLPLSPTELTAGNVNVLHGLRNSGLVEGMGKNGDMTIDIVAMLFDYILDDQNIPDGMRALIGRLQIPVLKVALLDRGFFSRKSHPARQLLNTLASTAVGLDDSRCDEEPVYRKIQEVVQTILDRFEDDVSLFAELLEDFEGYLEKEQQQAQARAERSVRTMEGQERLEVARSTTMEEIEPRLEDDENLDFIREFVSTHWKNLLFLTCARDGKDSEAWKQAVTTMDELIWSVKPKRTPEERKRLVSLQPGLLQRLRAGMERLSIDVTERDDFIARLVRAHGRTAVASAQQDPAPAQPSEARQEQDTPAREATPPVAEKQEVPQEEEESEPAEQESLDPECLEKARCLATGDWVEILDEGGTATRAKLSWVSPITQTYLFTNRQGLKAGNYTVEEFAAMLQDGRARVLDAAPLMDRAVSTVLEQYKKQ
ncbi:MAG TPA: DUF1631 domain-containing protein [Gammaproteobacteria bacterium]|nr:DUF1631 domain-containing protein [Gammaproteobacteria bacterium]